MFSITIIESGSFLADGGAMFGAIPKRAWLHSYPEVENNLCLMSMRSILAVSSDRKIIVDLGMGDKHLNQVDYYQPHNLKNISDEIQQTGISINEITDVVLSHLHFDHCGNATVFDKDKNLVPTFPNAKYWLSEKQWNNLSDLSLLEKDSIFLDNILPIKEAGLLNLIAEEQYICEGFRLDTYDGHTLGQLVPIISTADGIVAYPGDLIPTSAHVSLMWISAYDLCAQTSLTEKERFLKEAVNNNYTLVYYHDAFTTQSRVKKVGDNYKAVK